MLTLEYIPYSRLEQLSSDERIDEILSIVKQNRIVLLEGKLKKEEETELISKTMESINEKFKGVEFGTIDSAMQESAAFFAKLKKSMANILLGDRVGMTIIGPASIVKEIKQDPEKIQVFTKNTNQKKKRKNK
ncbi:hypothetical protein COV16_03045 [Candidatus Woesearchaeota archaeon CG10_big_fil_rev_8_21_14_0_10_34_8]|nr:MAG: hypothetical protein COV16_03045 [Candidatus Woesearchaeota archaeon CG10_big_fil_rev_8_21_14_0_10_34_8]